MRLGWMAVALMGLLSSGLAASAPVSSDAGPRIAVRPLPTKIIVVGDSTAQVVSGWAGLFCARHVSPSTACLNLARGGRSSSSYRAEGAWDGALREMRVQGYGAIYVLIQFGHNDQPGKPGISTDLETEFPVNLRAYVREARAAGAIPVLVTPLTRRNFVDGQVRDSLEPWADSIQAVAAELHVPVIDFLARSQAAVQKLGPAKTALLAEPRPVNQWLASADGAGAERAAVSNTGSNPGPTGAELFSAILAEGLVQAVPDLAKDILP